MQEVKCCEKSSPRGEMQKSSAEKYSPKLGSLRCPHTRFACPQGTARIQRRMRADPATVPSQGLAFSAKVWGLSVHR